MLSAVPWNVILASAPTIVDTARRLYDRLREKSANGASLLASPESVSLPELATAIDELRPRLDALQANAAAQADLTARMAAQEEALSQGIQALSSRITLLLWISSAALLSSVIAVGVAVLR